MTGRLGLALALPALLVLGGCIPQPATSQAQATATLYWIFIGAGAVVAALVWGLISWSILRYRRRDDSLPVQTRGNVTLEVIWTGLPILTVLVLFGLTLVTLGRVDARSGDHGVNVKVTAFQWQWRFDYLDAGVSVIGRVDQPPTFVVPAGVPVHVTLVSNDVDHAFWVPAFLFKRDAIPGHPTQFDFEVVTPGTYAGQCAEFCGVYHDRMLLTVQAVSQADYQAWLTTQRAATSPSPSPSGSAP
ncbi:MAG TPA: cytochrome c oxidase subunit II [Candidatus Limnocylindrales bacterium]